MSLQLLVISGGSTVDIIQAVPTLTWAGEYTRCSRTLDFGMISSDIDRNIPVVSCSLGDRVIFKDNESVLFDGFCFERTKSTDSNVIDISCCDRGIYLKKNKAVYKFSNMTAEAVTRRICTDFNVEPGNIAETGIKLTRNFIGVSLYQIIQTMYTLASERTGEKYQIRFEGTRLSVIKKGDVGSALLIEGGSNLMTAATTESINNMVNKVVVYDEKDKLLYTREDAELQRLYGVMQEYIKKTKDSDADKKAKQLLEDNGVEQKITLDNLGNVGNLTGGAVIVREPHTGLNGLFYIDSDTHTWKNSLYLNKLTVNFKKIMDKQESGSEEKK